MLNRAEVHEEVITAPQPQRRGGSALVQALRVVGEVLQRDRLALIGTIIYIFFILIAIFAPVIAPYGPLEVIEEEGIWLANEEPSARFPLGTTNLGRDIFSQLIYGTRTALLVGFSAAIAVAFTGTLVGLIAGYYGGWIDRGLMRLADVAFGIPFLPFIIVLVAFVEPSIWNIVAAMALLLWRDTGRVIRSQVLVVKEKAFVNAAKLSGASNWRIIFLYIAPSILPLSFLYGSLAIGWAIMTEASVSFLGFGDPDVVSWGFMLQDAFLSQAMSREAWYWIIPPGIAIMLTVMAGFFIGRGFEEVLFPRLRRQ
ncbi:MAG: ABC transporter permease [Candidatus Promineifilaceae bacterium]|nr:ABC transporter permease [Candidatus Promineifilaceae bacterium]